MTIECNNTKCKHHCLNSGDPSDEGPFCYESECHFESLVPAGYTADELDQDNPFNQWLYEGAWK